MNKSREKIMAGRPTFGFWMRFPSPELIEFVGHFGFDFVVIDAEHFSFGREATQAAVRAAQLVGAVPLVRVPRNDPETILGYLETGALGVVIPHVSTVQSARDAVSSVKYHPLGTRGSGAFSRTANYGVTQRAAEYFANSNDDTMVVPMIEDAEGFENLPGILDVDGVDCVMLGLSDLAMSMGFPGQVDHPRVQELAQVAREQIRASGKGLCATVRTSEEARRAVADGAVFVDLNIYAVLDGVLRDFAKTALSEG